MLSNVVSTLALLIIVSLFVITFGYSESMSGDAYYLTDSLVHRVINLIYSILLISYVWTTYGARHLKFLAVVAFLASVLFTANFIVELISQSPATNLQLELIYDEL
jgi:NADH:ubiquinone oxidoreductase subunit 6 (subunit J)